MSGVTSIIGWAVLIFVGLPALYVGIDCLITRGLRRWNAGR